MPKLTTFTFLLMVSGCLGHGEHRDLARRVYTAGLLVLKHW